MEIFFFFFFLKIKFQVKYFPFKLFFFIKTHLHKSDKIINQKYSIIKKKKKKKKKNS